MTQMFELYDEEYKATIIKCFKKQSHTQLKLIEEGKISVKYVKRLKCKC